MLLNTALLIIHGLVAVALLGAITHQTIAAWVPSRSRRGSFIGRFRGVTPGSFANAIVVLYVVSALLGAVLYLSFRTDIRPDLERAGQWQALSQRAFRLHRIGIATGLLGLLATTANR